MIPTLLIRRAVVVLFQASLLQLVFLPPAVAAAGDLDPTFGGDGRVATGFAGSANGSAVAIQADGKIVAAGTRFRFAPDDTRFALARYNTSGALDPTFGGDGRVVTAFIGASIASGVAIQADGKIVAAGTRFAPRAGFALARYNPSGALDPTFGGDGRVVTAFPGAANGSAVAIQADGSIVAAGTLSTPTGERRFALARYNPSGALDPTFGGDGRVVTRFAGDVEARGVAIQADGRIVTVGLISLPDPEGGTLKFALARYTSSGALDPTFGGDGRVVTGFGDVARGFAVAIQPDGKIVAAGDAFHRLRIKFALARYTPSGALDPTFGGDGRVMTGLPGGAEALGEAHGVVIQADGKVVAAGVRSFGDERPGKFALARYTSSGALDPTFGGDGRVVTGFAGDANATGVAIQSDGKIVAAGFLRPEGGAFNKFALARYLVA
jgi:uncharacterized delta-60 repeat protein